MMLAALLLPIASASSDAPFNPDRPGYADSTGSVPAGSLMTEAGVLLSAQDGAAVVDAPHLLVRGGLTDQLELRLSVPTVTTVLGGGGAAVGGPAVGLKYATALGGDAAVSVVGTLPVAAGPLDAAFGGPSVGVNAGKPVGDIGITANAVVSPGEVFGWAASLAAGYRAFYAQAALEGSGGEAAPLVGAGAALTPLAGLQLDAFVDVRPVDSAVSVGAGIARQW